MTKHAAIQVGLLGFGTVGSGTFKVLNRNQEEIRRRAGRGIEIKSVAVRNVALVQAKAGNHVLISNNPMDVVNDPSIEVIIEVIGGTTLAKDLVLAAIAKGKHVVTANKALLAEHGNEIFAAAQTQGTIVAFEAAVAASIPVIKALREGLSGNRIQWVAGIINGTTNFVLSQMRDQGLDFDAALQKAQHLGYAEADPSADIEGLDAAHKAAVLAAIAFGIPVQFKKTYIEGITRLQAVDINYAFHLGYRIKLLGIVKRCAYGIELRVHPTLIPAKCPLASVEDVMNAVMVKSDAAGITMYYGAGAGSEETASAVIADLVDVVRLHTADPEHQVPHLAFQANAISQDPVLPIDQIITSYYLRLRVLNEAGVLAQITHILAQLNVSIDAVIQRATEQTDSTNQTDLIILTHGTSEGIMNRALTRIQTLPAVLQPIVHLRKENLR